MIKKCLKIFLITFITILIAVIICFHFGWQEKILYAIMTPKLYVKVDDFDSVKVECNYYIIFEIK